MQVKGRVFKYGDNVDTDVIIPARYLSATSGEELAKHCMEDIDKEFIKKVQPGDLIVAQKNFGCGSSREPSISAFRSSNAPRRPGRSRPEMRSRWISTAGRSLTVPAMSPTKDRRFRRLCRRSFPPAD